MPDLPGGWWLVLAGGALGGALRYAVSEWFATALRERFPWATGLVNVSGAFVLGLLLGISAGEAFTALPAFLVYVLGSYTTVSAFALQTVLLQQEARTGAALLYWLGSATLCLLAVATGYLAGGG